MFPSPASAMTSPYAAGSRSIVDRMRGAALLDVATYEEVEHDTTATGQAAVVVALAAIAAAIGNAFRSGPGLVGGLVAYLVGWALWSGIIYLVGTRVFGGTATWGEVLRTFGFAQAPGLLLVAGFVPLLGGLLQFAVSIWVAVAGFVAIRQALDLPTGKTLLTVLLGWVASIFVYAIAGRVLGVGIR